MFQKFLLLAFISLFNIFYSQLEVLDHYPPKQHFYAGGERIMTMEMIQIVKKKGLLPCPDHDEKYFMKILVYADASISYVKDFDSLNIEKKKCAFDFGRKLIPYLKRWVPAKEDDKFVGAIANVEINPFLLYYSKDDPKDNIFTYPEFKKGLPAFSYEVRRIFEQKIRKNEDRYGSFSFTINEKGIMEDIKVEGEYTDQEKKQLASDLSKIKGEWNPASYNGIPRKYTLRQSVTQQFDIKTEHNKLNNPLNQNGFYRSH